MTMTLSLSELSSISKACYKYVHNTNRSNNEQRADGKTQSPIIALSNKPIPSNVLLPFPDYRSILVAEIKLVGEVTPHA